MARQVGGGRPRWQHSRWCPAPTSPLGRAPAAAARTPCRAASRSPASRPRKKRKTRCVSVRVGTCDRARARASP
eukprot:316853-Prymnesium_polylepis.1